MMFYDSMKGLHHEKSLETLKHLSGKSAPSRTKVFFWFGEFRRGKRSFDHQHRRGTSATTVTVTNIEATEKLIRVEPRVTTREILESLSTGTAATMSILHDHLRVRKRCVRRIPHSLTDGQRQLRVEWCEFMLRKFNGDLGRLVTELGAFDMIRKPECSQRFGCFRTSPLPPSSKDHAVHR